MENMIVYKDYTQGQLRKAFDKLTEGMENWKNPIRNTIHTSEWTIMQDACVYFTGSELFQLYDNGDATMTVAAEGYYNAIGA
jgi:hypothetical protein